jgi:ABC-type branched-subunit amino acid transport system ATPase component
MSQVFLIAGIALLVAGLALGLPAWRSWQARAAADRNAERYLAWRGRGDRTAPETATRMSYGEQRRLVMAVALAVMGGVALVIGLTTG